MNTVTQTETKIVAPHGTTSRKIRQHSKVSHLAVDGRAYLQIKAANLAQESRLIRKRARSARYQRDTDLCNQLQNHRVLVVRKAARETHLALGLIRGRTYEQMEVFWKSKDAGGAGAPDWDAVNKMLKKYGGPNQPLYTPK